MNYPQSAEIKAMYKVVRRSGCYQAPDKKDLIVVEGPMEHFSHRDLQNGTMPRASVEQVKMRLAGQETSVKEQWMEEYPQLVFLLIFIQSEIKLLLAGKRAGLEKSPAVSPGERIASVIDRYKREIEKVATDHGNFEIRLIDAEIKEV